jgi:hypothetical protein
MMTKLNASGGLKGTTYDGPDDPDLPAFLQARGMTLARRADWVRQHNERYRIVATCLDCPPEKRELIAEEVVQHRLNHLSGAAKSLAGSFELAEPAARAEFLAYLAEYHPE